MKNKSLMILILAILILTINVTYSLDNPRKIDLDSVTVIEGYKNMFQSGDYYFGGVPSLEFLRWLQSEDVTIIVNLRTEKEMEKFSEYAYDEASMAKELGMAYFLVPLDGNKPYTKETLIEFAKVLDENPGKVFIHCGACVRVTYLIMAYLIEYQNYPIDDVVDFGKKLRYTSPLEGLLDKEITLSFIE